jgi:hypothetical protein
MNGRLCSVIGVMCVVCALVATGCGGSGNGEPTEKTETWTFFIDGVEVGTMTTYHPGDTGGGEALGQITTEGIVATLTGTMIDGVATIRVEVSPTDIVSATGTYTETSMTGTWSALNGDGGTWSATRTS